MDIYHFPEIFYLLTIFVLSFVGAQSMSSEQWTWGVGHNQDGTAKMVAIRKGRLFAKPQTRMDVDPASGAVLSISGVNRPVFHDDHVIITGDFDGSTGRGVMANDEPAVQQLRQFPDQSAGQPNLNRPVSNMPMLQSPQVVMPPANFPPSPLLPPQPQQQPVLMQNPTVAQLQMMQAAPARQSVMQTAPSIQPPQGLGQQLMQQQQPMFLPQATPLLAPPQQQVTSPQQSTVMQQPMISSASVNMAQVNRFPPPPSPQFPSKQLQLVQPPPPSQLQPQPLMRQPDLPPPPPQQTANFPPPSAPLDIPIIPPSPLPEPSQPSMVRGQGPIPADMMTGVQLPQSVPPRQNLLQSQPAVGPQPPPLVQQFPSNSNINLNLLTQPVASSLPGIPQPPPPAQGPPGSNNIQPQQLIPGPPITSNEIPGINAGVIQQTNPMDRLNDMTNGLMNTQQMLMDQIHQQSGVIAFLMKSFIKEHPVEALSAKTLPQQPANNKPSDISTGFT